MDLGDHWSHLGTWCCPIRGWASSASSMLGLGAPSGRLGCDFGSATPIGSGTRCSRRHDDFSSSIANEFTEAVGDLYTSSLIAARPPPVSHHFTVIAAAQRCCVGSTTVPCKPCIGAHIEAKNASSIAFILATHGGLAWPRGPFDGPFDLTRLGLYVWHLFTSDDAPPRQRGRIGSIALYAVREELVSARDRSPS